MNKPRREHIKEVVIRLEELQQEIGEILDEEEEYRDNMPENLWGSERYEKADSACEYLEYAGDAIDDIVGDLEEAQA